MEHEQIEIFTNTKPSVIITYSESTHDMNENNNSTEIHITNTDHHIIEIISTYIKKLPDNHTKKQLARIMINFIMKSANL